MAEYNDEIVHECDGIQEQDNKLPQWWVMLFKVTIVFAVIYLLWFHVLGFGKLSAEKYEDEVSRAEAAQAARQAAALANMDLTMPSLEAAVLSEGSELYSTYCASCHHSTGRGLIGPNLTDNAWIHGAEFADSMYVIENGVLEKGMQAWKSMLSLRQRHAVASYIYSLRGSNPPEPRRAPQGEVVPGSDSPTFQL